MVSREGHALAHATSLEPQAPALARAPIVLSSLSDAKVSEDDVKQLLRVHPAADAAELVGGGAQLLARQIERRLGPLAC